MYEILVIQSRSFSEFGPGAILNPLRSAIERNSHVRLNVRSGSLWGRIIGSRVIRAWPKRTRHACFLSCTLDHRVNIRQNLLAYSGSIVLYNVMERGNNQSQSVFFRSGRGRWPLRGNKTSDLSFFITTMFQSGSRFSHCYSS